MRGASAIVALHALLACAPGDTSAGGAVVTDSAGVRVVRHDLTGVDVPPWRELAQHDLQIGVRDGEAAYSFSGVAEVGVADDGTIVVSDRVAREVRIFDPDGVWVRTLGGPGEGPGEFATAPAVAGIAADTVFLFDRLSARITPWTLGGDYSSPITLNDEAVGRPLVTIRQDDGTYLVQSRWTGGGLPQPHDVDLVLDSVAIARATADGTLDDSLHVMPDRRMAEIVQAEGDRMRVARAEPPYAARAFMLNDGSRTAVAHGSTFDFGFLDRSGQIVLRVVVDGVQHPASREDIRRRQQERILEDLDPDEITPMVRQLNVEFAPEKLQAFTTARFSTNGDLWVALQDFDEIDGTRWLVFAPDGSLRGSVHTPESFRLHHIRPAYLVGIVTDEFDVPYVRRYPLRPPAPGLATDD